MKKLFIIALGLVVTGTSAFANPDLTTAHPDSYSRPVDFIVRGSYHSIQIEDDIDVVLTESDLAGITVVANDKVKRDVQINVVNGVLKIRSTRKSLKNKAIVYVPVSNLERLEINGNSKVTSAGFLNSPVLKVVINGEAIFEIKNHGEVLFDSDNDTELHISKKYISPAVSQSLPNSDKLETDYAALKTL